MELVQFERVQLFTSPFILEEFEKVLRLKFGFPPPIAHETGILIRAVAHTVEPAETVNVIRRKISDNRILECALEANAEILVTGDTKDLLPLQSFHGIRILSPSQFLSEYFPTV